jgi:hypothetical protein
MMAMTDGHATWHVTITTLIIEMYMDTAIHIRNGSMRSTIIWSDDAYKIMPRTHSEHQICLISKMWCIYVPW